MKVKRTSQEQFVPQTETSTYDISDLPPGVYFVSIVSENYSSITKFVKE